MEKIKAEEAMKELTMMLLYLSRFSEKNRFTDGKDFYACECVKGTGPLTHKFFSDMMKRVMNYGAASTQKK